MRLPTGFYYKDSDNKSDYVLRLKRNLYGLKQASFNWYELLTVGLEHVGFIQSKSDPCLFLHPKIICVIYSYKIVNQTQVVCIKPLICINTLPNV